MTLLAAWTYANNQNSSLLPLYCPYTNEECRRMQSYWELRVTQCSQCPGVLVRIITASDFWDQEPGSISSHLHDERCRILWMRKCSHANWVMCGHGSHLQNNSLKKTEPTQVKIFQRVKKGLETLFIKTDNSAWPLQTDQIQHAQLPTRRNNECVHYQQFWWCLKQLSGVPSSKGPKRYNFQSKNTDQLKQKKVWSYKGKA